MGGIQVIAIGDFYQLLPVPNKWISDEGHYAFESDTWSRIVPHTCVLMEVQRQQEPQLINAVSEAARGGLSRDTTSFIKSLDNTYNRDIHLFPRKLDVSLFNQSKLQSAPGIWKLYRSEEGPNVSHKMRKSVDVPKTLALKVGAPVLLTVNLSRKYVNGLSGEVVSMLEDGVEVYFNDIKEKIKITPHSFFQYDHVRNTMRFVTRQIPLMLSYTITVHKSQGMTLPSVHVDCQGAFAPGQIAVALSRVRNSCDITVSNFREGLCPPHPPAINTFYGSAAIPPADDLSCCREMRTIHIDEERTDIIPPKSPNPDSGSETDFSASELDATPSPETTTGPILPKELSSHCLKKKIMYPETFTATQETINALIKGASDKSFDHCTTRFYGELLDIARSSYTKEGDSKQINSVVRKFIQQYRRTENFTGHLKELFGTDSLQNEHISTGVAMMLRIQDYYFGQSATPVQPTELVHEPYSPNLPKVRYMAGMCVGRIMFSFSSYLCEHCHEDSDQVKSKKATIRALQSHLYNTVTIAKDESQSPHTLSEINHRQYKYGHLTIVDDRLFEMFLQLDGIIHNVLSQNTWFKHKENFFQYLMSHSIEEVYKLQEPIYQQLNSTIMRPIFGIYLRTCMKEMGYRITQSLNVKKRLAHRKQVMLEESVRTISTPSESTPSETTSTSMTDPFVNPLHPAPPASQDANNNVASTSKQSHEDDCNTCFMCCKKWTEKCRLLWVECTTCHRWLHKKCDITLRKVKRWKEVRQEGAIYPCPKCREKGNWWGIHRKACGRNGTVCGAHNGIWEYFGLW